MVEEIMEELAYWIWISRIENVRKKIIFDLFQEYGTVQNMWNATKEELQELRNFQK